MPKNLHHTAYRPTPYNTNLAADLFQCPKCKGLINGIIFAQVVSTNPRAYHHKCPTCNNTYIKDFSQIK